MRSRQTLLIALAVITLVSSALACGLLGGEPTATPEEEKPPIATPTPEPTATPTPEPTAVPPIPCLTGEVPEGARLRLGGAGSINEAAFSPDGETLAIGTDTGVYLCRADLSGQVWGNAIDDEVYSVAWSPDGATLASGSWYGTIILWDAATGEPIRILEGHTNYVFSVAWSPDGATLASGSWDRTVMLWDAATGERLRTLEGHSEKVISVAWSSDGATLASGSRDHTIILWDVSGR